MTRAVRSPAVFLDRDGTLIAEKEYLSDPRGVEVLPGVGDALRSLASSGYLLIVVTNQSGIGRGYYSEADYRRVARRLDELLLAQGVRLDGTRHCPHAPDRDPPCDCRKPALGMYEDAAAEFGVDFARSWFVGDRLSDVAAAGSLGGRGVLVRTGYGGRLNAADVAPVPLVEDLPAAAMLILSERSSPPGD